MLGKITQSMYLNFLESVREIIIVFIMVILPTWFKNAKNFYPMVTKKY